MRIRIVFGCDLNVKMYISAQEVWFWCVCVLGWEGGGGVSKASRDSLGSVLLKPISIVRMIPLPTPSSTCQCDPTTPPPPSPYSTLDPPLLMAWWYIHHRPLLTAMVTHFCANYWRWCHALASKPSHSTRSRLLQAKNVIFMEVEVFYIHSNTPNRRGLKLVWIWASHFE